MKKVLSMILVFTIICASMVFTAVPTNAAVSFTPRYEAPTTDNPYYYSQNIFYKSGYGMPNCTCYAWGRVYEASGSYPNLPTGNANTWYNNAKCDKGSSPRPGAVICGNAGSSGHVAFVEKVYDDGVHFDMSESHWGGTYFDVRYNITSANFGGFQGFLYPFDGGGSDSEPPALFNIFQDGFSDTGYTLHFTATDNVGLKYATIYTNINGENRKEENINLSGAMQEVSYPVRYSDFNTSSGYRHGIWVYDIAGNKYQSSWIEVKPSYNPNGYLDKVECPSPGKLHVKGWAFDKDDISASLVIDVYVGGWAGSGAKYYRIIADKERTDVNSQFNCGNYHGFDEIISITESGSQDVYAYALNVGGGTDNPNLFESPKTVYITPDVEAPTLPNCYVENYTSEGYTLHFTLTDNAALSRVAVYTNVNNENRKEEVIELTGDTQEIVYEVKYNDFGTNSGYKHGIWAFDISGNKYQSPWILIDDYSETTKTILGDANGDGDVDAVDATVIQRVATNIAVQFDDAQLMCADVDEDDSLTVVDATFIQRHCTHIKTPYPIGEPI